jgi:DNA invertase Pin-like site-specific DNA recombinase
MRKFVSYCRVSTEKQGRSGLGLEAQRQAIAEYLNGAKPIAEFIEIESGKNDTRSKLREALHRAKVTGATMVIAKLDRLSRNVRFIAELQESKVKFVCCDMPDANELTIHIFASLAAWERQQISDRTKKALAAARKRGVKLGNPNGARALKRARRGNAAAVAMLKAGADRRADDVMPIVNDIRASGVTSLLGIADELNARGILTARGGQWYATTVRNLLARSDRLL